MIIKLVGPVSNHLLVFPSNRRPNSFSTFKSHKTCLTEDQRYGGKNYVAKEMKGQKKQEQWISKLQELISNSKFDRTTEGYLNRVLGYENIPRKKAKFLNFVKASIVKDASVGEKLWSIIEQAIKPAEQNGASNGPTKKSNGDPNGNPNGKLNGSTNNENQSTNKIEESRQANDELDQVDENGLKRKTETGDVSVRTKKTKAENGDLNGTSADHDESVLSLNESTVDDPIGEVIRGLIERSKETETAINPAKLAKKVLRRKENRQMSLKKFKKLIRRLGPHTEFKDLPINEFYEKFIESLSAKDCFRIDKEVIAYKQNGLKFKL